MMSLVRIIGRLTLITAVTAMLVFGGLLAISGLQPEAEAWLFHDYIPMCKYDYVIQDGDHVEAKVFFHAYITPW